MAEVGEEAFELTLEKAEHRVTALNNVAGTLTFRTTVRDTEVWERMVALLKDRMGGLKFYIYGSFEDEVALVLREDRNRWRKEAEIARQRVAVLEQQLSAAEKT